MAVDDLQASKLPGLGFKFPKPTCPDLDMNVVNDTLFSAYTFVAIDTVFFAKTPIAT